MRRQMGANPKHSLPMWLECIGGFHQFFPWRVPGRRLLAIGPPMIENNSVEANTEWLLTAEQQGKL